MGRLAGELGGESPMGDWDCRGADDAPRGRPPPQPFLDLGHTEEKKSKDQCPLCLSGFNSHTGAGPELSFLLATPEGLLQVAHR